jgi:hypothetical protein
MLCYVMWNWYSITAYQIEPGISPIIKINFAALNTVNIKY